VNKLIILIISIFLLNHCSLNENSRIWQGKDKNKENQKNIKIIFEDYKPVIQEFNPDLKLDLLNIRTNNKIVDDKNNFGSQDYDGSVNKIANFKFSKLEDNKQLDYKPIFLDDGLIFFDKKGSIIRYKDTKKIKWKKNHYSKAEKKLKPKIDFILDNENLIVTDNIAKYYSVNINSGKLNWFKNNTYPFNSEIKINKNKFFVVDYQNTLRCYNINDGSECWHVKTEDSFTISNWKFSLIIINDLVVFSNSIGDITAVDIKTGLIAWQLPTQSSNIINETYNFKISKLVSDNNSIYFSNNKYEFYSIDAKTGITNWITKINSNLMPVIIDDLIFTISNDGYFYVIDKIKGNIIRITNLYKSYKIKKRKKINPIGFAIGNTKLYLTNTDGKMIIVDLNLGKVTDIKKISGNFTSRPFIYNQNLFVIRNGSIVKFN
jgi:outer membrane protein assembly factor BamB